MKITGHRISIQTLLFQACLPTRQNGVETRDKAYFPLSYNARVTRGEMSARVSPRNLLALPILFPPCSSTCRAGYMAVESELIQRLNRGTIGDSTEICPA